MRTNRAVKDIFALGIFLVLIIGIIKEASAVWVWTPQTKQWKNPKYAPKDTPKAQFEVAISQFNAGNYKEALREFRRLIKYYPNSEFAPEAQYYIGLCLYKEEAYYEAFGAYQKVIETYPYNERVDQIIGEQYNIGKIFYDGYKSKLLGIAFLPSFDKAVEVFSKVVENAPYGKGADRALYYLGLSYRKMHKYTEAKEAFRKLLDEYPQSELANDAKFQIGLTVAEASPEVAYDQQHTQESIKEFEEFLQISPKAEKSKEATKLLDEMREKKAESIFDTAKFYEKIRRYKSAQLYYRQILNEYSDTGWAAKAAERLQILTQKGRI